MVRIDLNSDLGEGFGPWRMGDDSAMLAIVTSANLACGFHAGDPAGLLSVLRETKARNVTVGAHVGYRDLVGFGRREMAPSSNELVADTIYQIGALKALAIAAGTAVRYVKPHGALYNRIIHDPQQAADVITAMVLTDPSLAFVAPAGTAVLEQARRAGLHVVAEIFADRAYAPDGTLVSRSQPGSVLQDTKAAIDRVLYYIKTGRMICIDGSEILLPCETICVHGDTPGSVALASDLRMALAAEGVELKGFLDA